MAKLSGLIGSGKVGKADQKVVDAMPDAPAAAALDSSNEASTPEALDSSTHATVAKTKAALDSSTAKTAVTEMAVSCIRPSPYQVRAVADTDYIETLMASVAQSGVISPIVV